MTRRVFWNACPKHLSYFPETPCPLGKEGRDTKGNTGCDWFINDPEANFCFWKWVRSRSNARGAMEPLLLNKIATLLCIPNSKVQIQVREAIENFKNLPDFEDLEKLLD